MERNKQLGRLSQMNFTEKTVKLPDETILNYGEGEKNGLPLLLIHGQMVDWMSYEKVLSKLSREFHVFAIDCHGHGKSSKQREKYKANTMGMDFIWFIEHVIGEKTVVSGHSSGGLLAGWLAANAPQHILGAVLEDPPFFSTEPDRCENTFAWRDGFLNIHKFLNQTEERNYTRFYVEHCYLQNFFGNGWEKIRKYANRYMDKNPNKGLKIFFLPKSINEAFALTYGSYDLDFGDTFYDCSWFDGFDQTETLKKISCPTIILHASWQYDKNGILLGAWDGRDAEKASALIANNTVVNIKSGHSIHEEKSKEFVDTLLSLKANLPSVVMR